MEAFWRQSDRCRISIVSQYCCHIPAVVTCKFHRQSHFIRIPLTSFAIAEATEGEDKAYMDCLNIAGDGIMLCADFTADRTWPQTGPGRAEH